MQVGYYDITTSLDNALYTASSKSNHVLVDGTIFTANDLALIAGLSRAYSVTLLDAYKNPISNADIEFKYNGVTKHAKTNAQGVATINIGGLAKGDYPIVYTHAKSGNAGQSYVHVSQSILNKKNSITDLGPYLAATRNCQVSNSEIVSLAKKLTAGLTTPLDKAEAIFNYVRDTISYSYYYDTKYGAVETMHTKKGNCVDQSHLSVALYRAVGLPARYVHGFCTFSDGDVCGHVWTQVLIDNTWVVSDSINLRNSLGNVVNWNNNYQHRGYYSSLPF
jgi:transglutaminase-like putative cysteine protease